MVAQGLQDALMVYFQAKQLMYRKVPEFVVVETGPLKCFHKHPGWPEIDAFYAVDVEPSEAITAIARYAPHPQHMLTVFMPSPRDSDTVYEVLGYRPLPGAQPFMRLELSVQKVTHASCVVHVETSEQVDFINRPSNYMDASFERWHISLLLPRTRRLGGVPRKDCYNNATRHLCGRARHFACLPSTWASKHSNEANTCRCPGNWRTMQCSV